ncbi:MAG: hypothetical protein CMD49_03455 [Gammaproteobacteria bacterium]|nr:hypothetical protein [Gammaproteobacteria bacterium]
MSKKLIIFSPSIEDGGVEKNLFLISNYLSSKIPNLSIITADFYRKNNFSKKIKFITPRFRIFKNTKKYIKYLICIILLIRETIKDKRFIILSFQANIYAIMVAKFFGITILSRSNTSSEGWTKNRFKQLIFKYFFTKADEIIVNSYDFKKEIDKKYKINCKCILNPFNFKLIKKESLKKIPNKIFKKKSLKLISIGRLTDQKDHITLLKAIKLVVKKRLTELIILGKGTNESILKNYTLKNNLINNVKFLGYMSNPYQYIKSSDIFVLTSRFEGSPNVLVEAQYLKKYIISSNCPTGPKEILANGLYGDLFNVGDFRKLAKLILSYKKNQKIKKKINNAFKNTKKFEYKKNCEKYYMLISKYL